jgi:hypothetical protein
MSCLPSEGQATLTGAVGQGRDATVVLVAGAVEDDRLDTAGLGTLRDELADLAGLGGLVVLRCAEVGLSVEAETTVRPFESSTTCTKT